LELRIKALWAWLKTIHSPTYLAAKGRYLGDFSVIATLITALFVASTWLWDNAIDRQGMQDVIWLRVLQTLSLLALATILRANPLAWPARLGLFLVPAFVQITFIEVLNQLDGGLTYGIGGFLYFFIFVPFISQPQSLRFNALLIGFIAALPNALVLVGINQGLNLPVYNAYVWMAYGPIVLMLALIEYLIYQVHNQHGQLKRYADTDPLTGLTNRRTFLAQGHRLITSARLLNRPVSVLFADLDHFKALNDQHGHAAGDDALREVASRLAQCVRSTDIVARFGGEEFVVLLPDLDNTGAGIVADTICRNIASEPITAGEGQGFQLHVTVSVGYATINPDDDMVELDELIRRADDAVYRAKHQGRGHAVAAWQEQEGAEQA
jgi:diguanylate cyclase (GGDEF)-like protein